MMPKPQYTLFFMKCGHLVGPELTAGVLDFFKHSKMLEEINIIVLFMVAKHPLASKPSEFEPISCCSTIYKIISKMFCKL